MYVQTRHLFISIVECNARFALNKSAVMLRLTPLQKLMLAVFMVKMIFSIDFCNGIISSVQK